MKMSDYNVTVLWYIQLYDRSNQCFTVKVFSTGFLFPSVVAYMFVAADTLV